MHSDSSQIDKQRAYLGGDATHSILVKGLDYALLARTRAELAAKGEQVADEELEELVRGAQGKKAEKVEQKQPEEKMAKGVSFAFLLAQHDFPPPHCARPSRADCSSNPSRPRASKG